MKTNNTIITKVEALANQLTELHAKKWDTNNPIHANNKTEYIYKVGRKYIKIIMKGVAQQGAWGFVDVDGNVLKAETWNRPAKHARGNLLNGYAVNEGNLYSPAYLR